MAYLQRFLKIVYWKEEAREAEAHSGWPLYTITSKNIMAWALSRVLRDGPADTIVDRAELSLTTLGSAVDAAFQLETLCGARWSRQEFRVVADSMASLAKLNSPDMWFAKYLTLIVKRPYAGVRLITWGHNKFALPAGKAVSSTFPAVVATLGRLPEKSDLLAFRGTCLCEEDTAR